MTPPVSYGSIAFLDGIRDAEKLFDYYHEESRSGPPPREAEVLKRAGLITAMTAWETYVEDRVCEAVDARITATGANEFTGFFKARLDEELKRFNNPLPKRRAGCSGTIPG
jgi:hypothetical protein